MTSFGFVRHAATCLATAGLLLPQGQLLAQSGTAGSRITTTADTKLAADVVLVDGAFSGRVVDHNGSPLKSQKVVIKQGDRVVAEVATNDKGVFSAAGVRPGNYTATTGKTVGNFRVWSEQAAPPAAKGHALLVMGQNGARGQFGAVDPTLVLLTAAVIASVIISAISLDKINSVDDKVSQIPTSP